MRLISRAAVAARDRFTWASRLLGRCVAEELFADRPRRWELRDRPLGVVAGTRKMGLGRFFATFDGDSDGTVAVSETRIPGAADFVSLPVSHMGLLMSAKVARQTGAFLRDGRFLRD